MDFAVIDNNSVINIIVADNKKIAEEITGFPCINITDGWDYNSEIDGGDFFPKPEIVEVVEEVAEDNG